MNSNSNNMIVEILKEILKNVEKSNDGTITQDKTALNVNELAEYSGLSEDKIRQLVHTDDFPCFRNGNKWLINRELFDEWHKKVALEHRKL
jgi:excisionase family DNA binding protein